MRPRLRPSAMLLCGLLAAFLHTSTIAASRTARQPGDGGCILYSLDIPAAGEAQKHLAGRLDADQPCIAWQFPAQAGDRLGVTLDRTDGALVPALSVYVTPEGSDARQLLDRDMDLSPRAPGAAVLEVALDNLLTPGLYTVEVTQTGTAAPGDFTLAVQVARAALPRTRNLVALDGLLPVVDGGGPLYDCGTTPGVIDFDAPLPDGRSRDAGDRWVFYGEAGQTVNLTAAFDRAQLPYYYALEMSIWHNGVPDRAEGHYAVRAPGDSSADYVLTISDYALPETGYYTVVLAALYDLRAGGPPPGQRRLDYTLNYRADSCVWMEPETRREVLKLDPDSLLAAPGDGGLGFLQYNITAAPGPAAGVAVYEAVDQTRRGPKALTIVTHFGGLRQTNLAGVARTDNDRAVVFNYRALEVYTAPELLARIIYLESYLTLELANGGVFVTEITGDAPAPLVISPTTGGAVRIDTPSGQTFVSDWAHPETVWAVEDRFFVRIEGKDAAAWVTATSPTLRVVAAGEGLAGISTVLVPPQSGAYQEIVAGWQPVTAVHLQAGDTARIEFGGGQRFITDAVDTVTVTGAGGDTRVHLKARNQNLQIAGAGLQDFGLVHGGLFIDFAAGRARQPIAQSFEGVTAFAEETFKFGAVAPVSTGNYIVEWQDGTRAMLLAIEEQIVAPPEDLIHFNPKLPAGALDLETPGRLELALPQDMNNRGAEFTPGVDGDLVNPANGNMMYAVTDVYAPGPGLDLALTRTYNSLNPALKTRLPRAVDGQTAFYGLQDAPPRAFGPGWTSDVDVALDLTGALIGKTGDSAILDPSTRTGFVMLSTASGSQHYFYRDLNKVHGSPAPGAGCDAFYIPYYSDTARAWRVEQCLSEWRVVRDDNLTYHFDRAGRLTAITHSNGYALALTRGAPAEPLAYPDAWRGAWPVESAFTLAVTNPYGAAITLHYGYYNPDPAAPRDAGMLRVLRADAPDGARTFYHYDPLAGDLDRVQYPDGREAVYRYEAGIHRLVEHQDPHAPDLPYMQYTYDGGRVDEVYVFQGGAAYDPDRRALLLAHNYTHDSSAGVYTTAVVDAQRDRETRYVFNEAAPYRLQRRLDEHHLAGAGGFLETTFTFNRVPLSFPRFFKDEDPGPNELLVLGSLLEPGRAGVPRETNFTFGFGFDEQGRLSQLAEVRSQTIDYLEYDPFGRLARFTDAVTTDAQWHYTYDPAHGMLTQATDPDGMTTTFCYAPVQLDTAAGPAAFYRLTWRIGPYRVDAVPIEFGADVCVWFAEGGAPPAFFPLPAAGFAYDGSGPYIAAVTNWAYNDDGSHTPYIYTIRRDVMGRLLAVDGPDRRTRYVWGSGRDYERLVRVDELGTADGAVYQTCYTYTPDLGQLASVTDPANRQTVYTYYGYENLHRPASETDYHDAPCGASPAPENRLYEKRYTYTVCLGIDAASYDRCGPDPFPAADVGARVKDLYIRVDVSPGIADSFPVDEAQRYTVYHYDERDDLVETIERRVVDGVAYSQAACYRYDEIGNLVAYADGQPGCDFLAAGADPNGGRYFTFTYNYNNQLLGATDRMFARPTFEGGEDIARVWRFEYFPSPFGDPDNSRPPVTLFEPAHTRAWPGLGAYAEVSYDKLNRPVEVREYEAAGSRELVRTTGYTYDAWGNVAGESVNGFDGPTRFYCYDTLNRLATIRNNVCDDPKAILESFAYDAAGNLASWTQHDPGGASTYTFAYDAFNRVSAITDPLGHTRYFGYDAAGELVYETDWNGALTTYRRIYRPGPDFATRLNVETCQHAAPFPGDAEARALAGAGCAPETAVRSGYDGFGRLRSVDHYGMERTTYAYDMWDRRTAERRTVGDQTRISQVYAYDGAGNLVSITGALGETYNFGYDARGNLSQAQDPLGYTQGYTYDAHNNLIVYEDTAAGQVIDLFYDGLNRLDCMIYRQPGQPSSREARCNDLGFDTANLVDFDYDAAGNIIEIRQSGANGAASYRTRYTYRDFTRLARVEVTAPDETGYAGWRYDYDYHATGLVVTAAPPGAAEDDGSQIVYQYDRVGNLVGIRAPVAAGGEAYNLRAWYDGNGARCGYQLYPDGAAPIDYQFDGAQCAAQPVDTGDGTLFNFYTYWPDGSLRTVNDVQYFYDQLGRLSRVEHPQAGATYYLYESTVGGVEVSILEPLAPNGCDAPGAADACRQTRLIYDHAGALVALEQPPAAYRFVYDPSGSRTRVIDGAGRAVLWAYDSLGQVTRFEDRTGASSQAAYTPDRFHRLAALTDNLGGALALRYDLFGRLADATNALGARMTYRFDALHRLVTVFGPQATARLETPGLDPPAPGAPSTDWVEYDARGNPVARWRGGSTAPVRYTYDNLGRLAGVAYPQGGTYTYTYDIAGNLTRIEAAPEVYWAYRWRRAFDRDGAAQSQLVEATEAGPGNVRRQVIEYDAFNHRTCLALYENDAPVLYINYGYSLDGKLEHIGASPSGCAGAEQDTSAGLCRPGEEACAALSYERPAGRLAAITRSNGVCTAYTYDAAGNLDTLRHFRCASGEVLASYKYEAYDANGAPLHVTVNGSQTVLYSYDGAGRLTDERWLDAYDQLQYALSITYDEAGNRRTVSVNGVEKTYCYDGLGQRLIEIRGDGLCAPRDEWPDCSGTSKRAPTHPISMPGDRQYAYDAAGRVCLRIDAAPGGPASGEYAYNDAGQITQVSHGDRYTFLYYDPLGQVESIDTAGTASFWYDGGDILRVRDDRTARYLVGPHGEPPLWTITEEAESGARRVEWLLYDGLGSVRLLVDAGGYPAPGGAFDYNAFGEAVGGDALSWGPRYQGAPAGLMTGVDYYLLDARVYDPAAGRYLQPGASDTANQRYAFAGNHPTPHHPLIELPAYPSPRPPSVPAVSAGLLGLDAPLPPVDAALGALPAAEPELTRARAGVLSVVAQHWNRNGARWLDLPPALAIGRGASPAWTVRAALTVKPDLAAQLDEARGIMTPFTWPAPADWRGPGAARPDYGAMPSAPDPIDLSIETRVSGLVDLLNRRPDAWPTLSDVIAALAAQTPGGLPELPDDARRVARWLGAAWPDAPHEPHEPATFALPDIEP
ncbi:MAG: RHS repeat protein [Anaerolineae bacterium]|nr:RHS repeat protein [Anaerolineae bacterium]